MFNRDRAEKLIQNLIANPRSSNAGVMMNDLLSEFHRGYPLDALRQLLVNENPEIVAIGAWIASELGEKGRPLLPAIFPLLRHASKGVRFDLIDCILLWATPSDGPELSAVLTLLHDPESAVRWKAIGFLTLASMDQLRGMLSHLERIEPGSNHIEPLRWLVTKGAEPKEIRTALQGENALLRKFAVAAASRISEFDRDPLLYASSVPDRDVESFAKSALETLRE